MRSSRGGGERERCHVLSTLSQTSHNPRKCKIFYSQIGKDSGIEMLTEQEYVSGPEENYQWYENGEWSLNCGVGGRVEEEEEEGCWHEDEGFMVTAAAPVQPGRSQSHRRKHHPATSIDS